MADLYELLGQNIPALQKPEEEEKKPPTISKKALMKQKRKEKMLQRKLNARKFKMRNELQSELELSRKTAAKLKLQWENTIRDSKLVELKTELLEWEEKVTRQFQRKDKMIQEKLIEWDCVEELDHLIKANVNKFTDYLADIFKTINDGHRLLYETIAFESVKDFEVALREKRNWNRSNRIHFENIMNTTNVICQHELLEDYNGFVQQRNEKANIEMFKRYIFRDEIVKKLQDGRQQLLSFIKIISSDVLHPNKYVNVRKLMSRHRFFSSELIRLREQEAKHQHKLNELSIELLKFEVISQKRIQELRLEQSFFSEIRNTYRYDIQWDRQMTMEKMKVLGSESYVVLKHFEKYRNFGEQLLSIAATVRRYQTQDEKMFIWGDLKSGQDNFDTSELKKFMLTEVSSAKHLDSQSEEFYNEINLMRVFWRRLAIVEAQNSMLAQEKIELLAENKKYTDFIRSMSMKPAPEMLKDSIFVQTIVQLQTKSSAKCRLSVSDSVSWK